MLDYSDLAPSQIDTIAHLYDFNETFLVAEMGMGKTVCTLTAISELKRDGLIKKVLIIAPLAVAKTVWREELKEWKHLDNLRAVNVLGTEKERLKALNAEADIYIINVENVPWLFKYKERVHGFDGLVIDESSLFVDPGSRRFRSIRYHIKSFYWRVVMTGTPVSENWLGLYSQMMLCDDGERLGRRMDTFKARYFEQLDYQGYKWGLKEGADLKIMEQIRDVMYMADSYVDELPALKHAQYEVEIGQYTRDIYEYMRVHGVVKTYYESPRVVAPNAAVQTGKLEQLANEFIYAEDDQVHAYGAERSAKMDALVDLLVRLRKENRNVLIVYKYTAQKDALGKLQSVTFLEGAGMKYKRLIDNWNKGKTPILALHPKSASHGLNLAKGGCDIVFLAPIWSNDQTKQVISRLWRRGQTKEVTVHTLVTKGTVEMDIVNRITTKEEYMARLRAAQ